MIRRVAGDTDDGVATPGFFRRGQHGTVESSGSRVRNTSTPPAFRPAQSFDTQSRQTVISLYSPISL